MTFLRRLLTAHERELSFATHPRKMMSRSGGSLCDFCGSDQPVYVYGANRMVTGERTPCWRWCACVTCAEMVEDGRWDGLELRTRDAVRKLPGFGGANKEELLREIVEHLYNDFRLWVTKVRMASGTEA